MEDTQSSQVSQKGVSTEVLIAISLVMNNIKLKVFKVWSFVPQSTLSKSLILSNILRTCKEGLAASVAPPDLPPGESTMIVSSITRCPDYWHDAVIKTCWAVTY